MLKISTKPRRIGSDHFTFDKNVILDDPEINLVVELISDPEEAYSIVKQSLMSGKNVVSANKKMLALHLPEMIELQQKYNTSFYTKPPAVDAFLSSVTSKSIMIMRCCFLSRASSMARPITSLQRCIMRTGITRLF